MRKLSKETTKSEEKGKTRRKEKMMEKLVELVKQSIKEECEVTSHVVVKNNGTEKHGIKIAIPGEVASPVVYVDDIFEAKLQIALEEAAKEVVDICKNARSKNPFVYVAHALRDKDFILERVEYRVINAEKNTEILMDKPYKSFLDLAVIYTVIITDGEERVGSYTLTKRNLIQAGIDEQELDNAALRNMRKQGFLVTTINEMLGMPNMFEEPRHYVMTNKRRKYGASILLFKDELASVAEKMHGDFYILPSSVHEVLAVPEDLMKDQELKEMVKNINDSEVAEEEILSYTIYKYNCRTGEVGVAA